MVEGISLELFKKHVRADDFADDDDYLFHLLDTATSVVTTATNRTTDELLKMGGGNFPPPLVQAILMLGAHWYNQRESASGVQMYNVPDSMQALVKPYRKLVQCKQDE